MSGPGENRWRGGPSRQSSQRNGGNRDKTGGQGGARDANAAWNASSAPQEQHVPVRGFNAAEAKNVLKRGPKESKPNQYKPTTKDAPNRASGAWGTKPHLMANGKDFFVELRKQITSLQRGPPIGG
ncbi:hypothetical protein N7508_001856 [Penicillium antarcticum]|uniref:uncharacterized protein n=1 Tax=Penicillium antarcticum TaxID=416450 RepID=UPI00239AD854|nr:uncharacterized protein N7508_001856 [Penicillium antarcticum]KAJ5317348.1 hypothetical protein N7508_001856 [Penicillium antarcticum]